jgi:hypothetical protein
MPFAAKYSFNFVRNPLCSIARPVWYFVIEVVFRFSNRLTDIVLGKPRPMKQIGQQLLRG